MLCGSCFSIYVPHTHLTAKLHCKGSQNHVCLSCVAVGPKTLCRRSIRGVRCRCCCGTSALPRSSSSSSRSCRRRRRLAATARTAVGVLGSFAKVRERETERDSAASYIYIYILQRRGRWLMCLAHSPRYVRERQREAQLPAIYIYIYCNGEDGGRCAWLIRQGT